MHSTHAAASDTTQCKPSLCFMVRIGYLTAGFVHGLFVLHALGFVCIPCLVEELAAACIGG